MFGRFANAVLRTFRVVFVATVLGAVTVGFVDWAVRAMVLAEHAPPGLVSRLRAALEIVVLHGLGAVLLAVCVSPVVVFVGRICSSFDESGEEGEAGAAHLGLLGPGGCRVITVGVLIPLGLVVWVVMELIRRAMPLQNIFANLAAGASALMGIAVPLLIYRILVRLWPRFAAPRALVLGTVTFAGYLIVMRWGTFVAPHRLWIAYPVVMVFAGWTAFSLLLPASSEVRRVLSAVAVLLAVTAGIGAALLPFGGAAHAEAMQRTVLSYPAYQILTAAADLDGDGTPAAFGGADCDDLDPERRPTAFEIPGNGTDDNCRGGDGVAIEYPDELPELQWSPPTKPNIIFITIDTLRADYVGRRIDGRSVTPTLDAFAEGAFVFRTSYSASTRTDEAIPAVMTGRYPGNWHQHGVYFGVDRSFPEVLGELGYETIGILAFPWMQYAVMHGIDYVDNSIGERLLRDENLMTGGDTTSLALDRIDERERPDDPFFLWVHFFDPHAPNIRVGRFSEWLGDDGYLHEVHATDLALRRLFAALQDRDLFRRSIVVIMSDHGEARGAHGIRTHVWGAYEPIVRVPLMMRLPNIKPGTSDEVVSLVDVFPTLIDYLGIRGTIERSGTSLMPIILGQPMDRGPVFFEANKGSPVVRAVRDGDWKFIYDWRRNTYELYDLSADPDELVNLVDEQPERADDLKGVLWRWWDRTYNEDLLRFKRKQWDERGRRMPRKLIGADGVEYEAEIDRDE